MLMIEKNAGEIRCCGPSGCGQLKPATVNYDVPEGMGRPHDRYCIGAKCAAWNYLTENLVVDIETAKTRQLRSGEVIDPFRQFIMRGQSGNGFCGLAGRPEL